MSVRIASDAGRKVLWSFIILFRRPGNALGLYCRSVVHCVVVTVVVGEEACSVCDYCEDSEVNFIPGVRERPEETEDII